MVGLAWMPTLSMGLISLYYEYKLYASVSSQAVILSFSAVPGGTLIIDMSMNTDIVLPLIVH